MLKTEVRQITPGLAKRWLDQANTSNRNIRDIRVERYANDMRMGQWLPGAGSIVFDTNGTLVNGQHRLLACVRANVPFESVVVHGVDPAVFTVEDTGLSRSLKDSLDKQGEISTTTLAAALNLSYRWYDGSILGSEWPSVGTALHWLSLNPTIREAVRPASNLRGPLAMSVSAAVAFIHQSTQIDPAVTEDFLNALRSGAGLREGDPIFALRSWALNMGARRASRPKPNATHYLAMLVKTWNAWVEGREVRLLSWRRSPNEKGREEFPAMIDLNGNIWEIAPETSLAKQL